MSKTITFNVVPIPASDLKIESIDLGVRITHIPTGLTASCDSARSQFCNKNIAMGMIEWGLYELKG